MAAAQSKNQELLSVAKSLKGTPWCEEYERMISGMLYVLSPASSSPLPALIWLWLFLDLQHFRTILSGLQTLIVSRYNPLHPILLEGRHKARCAAYKFNNLDPNAYDFEQVAEVRTKLLEEMLGSVGEGTYIETPFLPDYGCNIIIGKNCFMNFG